MGLRYGGFGDGAGGRPRSLTPIKVNTHPAPAPEAFPGYWPGGPMRVFVNSLSSQPLAVQRCPRLSPAMAAAVLAAAAAAWVLAGREYAVCSPDTKVEAGPDRPH